jgi:hypothetical protein
MAAKLVSGLMHSRTQAHIFHLRTKSFAAHKALQGYYEGIVPLLDEYSEGYQGRYGLISGYKSAPVSQNPMMAKAYFSRLLKIVNGTKIKDSYLKNILDTIRQLIYQTLYLLTLDSKSATRSKSKAVSTKARQNRQIPTSRNT